MKNLLTLAAYVHPELTVQWSGMRPGINHGVFMLPSLRTGRTLRILASADDGWDHVSVSLEDRCPTWGEMDLVKRTFFEPHEVVMQLHPAEADHINIHPYCLHLWRPWQMTIPLPPKSMVA
jgi:hypothetical protein